MELVKERKAKEKENQAGKQETRWLLANQDGKWERKGRRHNSGVIRSVS